MKLHPSPLTALPVAVLSMALAVPACAAPPAVPDSTAVGSPVSESRATEIRATESPVTESRAAEPPGIPDAATARNQLAELTVAPEGSMDGYDRDKFPHWSSGPDNCNTREIVLERDGENVEVGNDCYPTSGTWDSPYDSGTWSDPSDVDIDHVVPLAAAWRSGASEWTTDRREAFANDLDGPQLLAVTDNVNQEKGDQTPDEWLPPDSGYHCTYGKMWVATKHKWELTVTESEKAALEDLLATC